MNTTEIRALVAQKIAGQGMMVDAGASLQPIVESLCNIIDAQAEQLANLKEYTAGLGIAISEQGEISTPLVVDLTGIVPLDYSFATVSEDLVTELTQAVAVKVQFGGITYWPNINAAGACIPRQGYTLCAAFGFIRYDDQQDVSSYSVIAAYRDDGDQSLVLGIIEN